MPRDRGSARYLGPETDLGRSLFSLSGTFVAPCEWERGPLPTRVPACNFYQPHAVPMGSVAQPVAFMAQHRPVQPLRPTMVPQQQAYYYVPQADDILPMGTVLQ